MNDNLWTNEQVDAMFECNERGCKVSPPKVVVKSSSSTKKAAGVQKKFAKQPSTKGNKEDEEELLKRKRLERSQFFKRPSCNCIHNHLFIYPFN